MGELKQNSDLIYHMDIGKNPSSPSYRWEQVHKLVCSMNNQGKVLQAIYENYLYQKYYDPSSEISSSIIDWMCHSEIFLHNIHKNQWFFLNIYIPYASINVHSKISNQLKPEKPF